MQLGDGGSVIGIPAKNSDRMFFPRVLAIAHDSIAVVGLQESETAPDNCLDLSPVLIMGGVKLLARSAVDPCIALLVVRAAGVALRRVPVPARIHRRHTPRRHLRPTAVPWAAVE